MLRTINRLAYLFNVMGSKPNVIESSVTVKINVNKRRRLELQTIALRYITPSQAGLENLVFK